MTKSKLCFLLAGCIGAVVVGYMVYDMAMKKKCLCLDCLCDNFEDAQD